MNYDTEKKHKRLRPEKASRIYEFCFIWITWNNLLRSLKYQNYFLPKNESKCYQFIGSLHCKKFNF